MKLLIANDGSDCAESALDDLTHAGLPAKGEALVMTVAEVWLPPPPPSAEEIVQLAVDVKGPLGLQRKYMASSQTVVDADQTAEKAAARFQANFPQWKVKHESSWGSPNVELFLKAEELKVDLIVVGSHGRSALGRIFLGSISQWLLNEAKCSVRIARGRVDEPDFPVRVIVGVDGSRNANSAVNDIGIGRREANFAQLRSINRSRQLLLASWFHRSNDRWRSATRKTAEIRCGSRRRRQNVSAPRGCALMPSQSMEIQNARWSNSLKNGAPTASFSEQPV